MRHRATDNREAFPIPLAQDIARHIDTPVLFENALDLGAQRLVSPDKILKPSWVGPRRQVVIMGGGGDQQSLADRLDPMLTTMVAPLGVCMQTPAGNG
ncbi:hypothetical protein J4E08_00135 [Sagittula sp. NFXS13]|uniref:hypothetical protein n=1 Tax=Sagittula sp. NFXS13 TaxID=2819095 RepID=UPI0032DEE00E